MIRTINKVEVTEDDIRSGRMGCYECPIALAISRALGKQVFVSWRSWNFVNEYKYHLLPAIAIHFIKQFDSHSRVSPINFEITLSE